VGVFDLAGLQASPVQGSDIAAKFDLTLNLREAGGRIGGFLSYATALFDRATIERHVGYLKRVLQQMAVGPDLRVSQVDLLADEERDLLLEVWNRTEADYPSHLCVHQLFEAQVQQAPEAMALLHEDQQLTYGELNARANRLAHHLVSLGVGPDDLVAISVERSLEMVVGLLAVLKAGGAYVPLDPAYPAERLAFMVQDSAPKLVLTHGAARAAVDGALAGLPHAPAVIDLDLDAGIWAEQPAADPDPKVLGLTPTNLAYVIYTSGSTGTPKGVMVEHDQLVVTMTAMQNICPVGNSDILLQRTAFSFDVCVQEMFWPLLQGATVVIADATVNLDPAALVDVIVGQRITLLHSISSALDLLLDAKRMADCTSLRHIFCGGDPLSASSARRSHELLPAAQLYNLYGPTEASIDVTAWACPATYGGTIIPMGRPIANARIYILNDHCQPVPLGVVGEIYIGGPGVARGYLNRPDLTAERFIASPFVAGDRLYRTGDLARYLPDGNIVFAGRNDFQVKIRGLRIDPGEIEARILEHPDVVQAVVVARQTASGDKRLVAYYLAEENVSAEILRNRLAWTLPDQMVPAAYVRLTHLPLTPNGKLDRKALPEPNDEAFASAHYEPPQGRVETALARIWSELLGIERVGRLDDFFELGGHSLLAVRMVSRIREVLGVEISLRFAFEFRNLDGLSSAVEEIVQLNIVDREEISASIDRQIETMSDAEVEELLRNLEDT
jgi:amino acid adenylation domain-containing protein